MKVIILYEKKFIKKSFLIRQDVSNLRWSYQLSDLSQNDYFAMRIYIYIYIYIYVCIWFQAINIVFGDFVRNERNSIWKVLVILFW